MVYSKNSFRKLKIVVIGVALVFFAITGLSDKSFACVGCVTPDVQPAVDTIIEEHRQGKEFISEEFSKHRDWIVNTFFKDQILPALQAITEQMSAVAMQQTMIIGTFFDAKNQLETQRLFQELQVEAHKDYHPSEDFCWFGTNVKSLSASDLRSRANTVALSQVSMARHLGKVDISGSEGPDQDKLGRWKQFTKTYCDPKDNNWQGGSTGLVLACGSGAADKNRINRDIDFTRLIEESRTLDVNFTDDPDKSADEEDVIALANNLYGHDVLSRELVSTKLSDVDAQRLYLGLRSVAAKRSVAENSYNSIVGLKSSGSAGAEGADTWKYLGAIMVELGVEPEEVSQIIGENPSYYAQLELLAKKIYQNPDFYANLYDKPVNVKRKGVALRAIDLMLDRAIYESQVRQEMVMSVLLASKLRKEFRSLNTSE